MDTNRKCLQPKCKHLSKRGLTWCKPHYNTNYKKAESKFQVMVEQMYRKTMVKLIHEMANYKSPFFKYLKKIKNYEGNLYHQPVILSYEHGFKYEPK